MSGDRHGTPSPAPGRKRSTLRRPRLLFSALAALLVLVGIGWMIDIDRPVHSHVVRDGDLCPIDGDRVGGDVVFLFDFTKPLGGVSVELPSRLFRDFTMELGRDTEIRAYLLTGSAEAPLAMLGRFCKPFDTSALQAAQAKDQTASVRECDDLSVQSAAGVRDPATRFCAVRNALRARIDALVARASREQGPVANAHLIEGLEDIRIDFQEQSGPHRLHVFSDMMQHAHWYSHLDLDWAEWDYDEFSRLLASSGPVTGKRRQVPNADIDVHYVPRVGITTQLEARERHEHFWRSYFAGSTVTFHEHSPIPAYAARPLMGLSLEPRRALHAPAGMERFVVSARPERVLTERAPTPTVEQGSIPRSTVVNRNEAANVVEEGERPAVAATEDRKPPTAAEPPEQTTNVGRAVAGAPSRPPSRPVGQHARSPRVSPTQQVGFVAPVEARAGLEKSPAESTPPPGERPPSDPMPGLAPNAVPAGSALELALRSTGEGDEALLGLAGVEGQRQAATPETPTEPKPSGSYSGEQALEGPTGAGPVENAAFDAAPCRLYRHAGLDRWQPEYPLQGRRDFGDAIITVRYAVDEAGETIDEEIAVVRDRSSADRTRFFNRFAQEALDSVRNWKFSVAEQDSRSCAMDVSYVTTIRFQYD